MQRELWAAVDRLGLGVTQDVDGTLRFKVEDWVAINSEAHKLRDKRFGKWYFSEVRPAAMVARMIEALRAHSLPYEVEFHDSVLLFLLPQRNEHKHREIMFG
jgi:hypothetical protein